MRIYLNTCNAFKAVTVVLPVVTVCMIGLMGFVGAGDRHWRHGRRPHAGPERGRHRGSWQALARSMARAPDNNVHEARPPKPRKRRQNNTVLNTTIIGPPGHDRRCRHLSLRHHRSAIPGRLWSIARNQRSLRRDASRPLRQPAADDLRPRAGDTVNSLNVRRDGHGGRIGRAMWRSSSITPARWLIAASLVTRSMQR